MFKAEIVQEGIIFLIHLFARAILSMKKLKIEDTKATKYSTFKTDIIKVDNRRELYFFFLKFILRNLHTY